MKKREASIRNRAKDPIFSSIPIPLQLSTVPVSLPSGCFKVEEKIFQVEARLFERFLNVLVDAPPPLEAVDQASKGFVEIRTVLHRQRIDQMEKVDQFGNFSFDLQPSFRQSCLALRWVFSEQRIRHGKDQGVKGGV